eukprot:Gregarina_sp_Poly_1__554@NODE_1132_length_4988_cov_108_528145_g782_i0_p3_GENE_NODE_1132_length_4988_cov_108_528145_g782_i0NODE_1132_length_4988_cov_108_528145_g782_i0_p3_ORF_typecomplete_len357_score40_91zfB_box/PF00643_24/0_0011zfB_box/PF00643_24/0_0024CEBP_ZZ/PF16366_5/0_004CEBP_ZZ/PF16366_5/1_2e03_NODE_1132_length_4988_cov_108_528145_g782_i02951365
MATTGIVFSLEPRSMGDMQERSFWEYLLKYMYYTADLYVADAKLLVSAAVMKKFSETCDSLGGTIVHSVFDVGRITPLPASRTFEENGNWLISELRFGSELPQDLSTQDPSIRFLFPMNHAPIPYSRGNATTFRVVIFKICLGSSIEHQQADYDLAKPLPDNLDSIVVLQENSVADQITDGRMGGADSYRPYFFNESAATGHKSDYFMHDIQQWAKLKYPQMQALPILMCDIDFRPLRIEVALPMCDDCGVASAEAYCPAEKTHFCDSCDGAHHSRSNLVAKHIRRPITDSPHIFGCCVDHPAAVIESVCLACHQTLCSYCLLLGNHSMVSKMEHPIVSTVEAFRLSVSKDNNVSI